MEKLGQSFFYDCINSMMAYNLNSSVFFGMTNVGPWFSSVRSWNSSDVNVFPQWYDAIVVDVAQSGKK